MQYFFLLLLFLIGQNGFSNKRSSEIYLDLLKLQSLKRVLYIAAHPDDENTRALAWFSLGEKAETAYLSLTRGDGGQNLIGDELSEELGVLRTQELLAARSYDGARQFFSRAVDFGYSKSSEESFEKWGEEEILSDIVLIIRQFRPDVIITRFPPDKRGGHGHHTASAILALEAFKKAADPDYLPKQVDQYGAWKTTSIYWNSSNWWVKDIADSAKNNPDYIALDIGGYNPQLGMSYNEIGTIARSQHKCQGFGAVVERGPRIEYFQHLAGKKCENSFFEKNQRNWSQIIDQRFETDLNNLCMNFNFRTPEKEIDALLAIQNRLSEMPTSTFKDEKVKLCNSIIINSLGLYLEIIGEDFAFVQNDFLSLDLNVVNRSGLPLTINTLSINEEIIEVAEKQIPPGRVSTASVSYQAKENVGGPYWLKNKFSNLFVVKDPKDLGKAEGAPSLVANLSLRIKGDSIALELPIEYKWRDPSFGEKRRDLVCTPAYTASFDQEISILKPGPERNISVTIHSFKDSVIDVMHVVAPAGWNVRPQSLPVEISNKHAEVTLEFIIDADENAEDGYLKLTDGKGKEVYSYKEIAYDHIPTQTLMNTSDLRCVKLEADIKAGKIAYIKGVQDAVPGAIKQLGFEVKEFEVEDLSKVDLSQFQSVVLGIRIYSVHPEFANYHEVLLDYIYKGGNVVMQYNTASRSIENKKFGPAPFQLSRNRVTDENAEVTFLSPDHPIMNVPNKISHKDFDGWVQERGLYFANDWDSSYTPLFSWHDKGEKGQEGAIIVTSYGRGQFIYTGISFFRELPNGVPGAYRLFANILSYQP